MSTSYEAVGSIIAIFDTEQVTDTFKKREFAIEIQDGLVPAPHQPREHEEGT